MTYLPPPKGTFDVEWATQNNRIIQQELGRLQPLQVRVADLESGKQPLDGDLTAIAALTGTGYIRRTADDTWAISATIPNTSITGLGTASTQNTGTSGATIPFLNGNNTWSGTNGFQAVTATTLSTTSTATIGGNTSIAGTLRATQGDGVFSGYIGATKGIRIAHDASASYIEGVDSTLVSSYQPLEVRGSTLLLAATGGTVSIANNTSITGTLSTTSTATIGGNLILQADNVVVAVRRANGTNYATIGDTGGTDDGGVGLYNSSGTITGLLRGQGSSFINGGNVGIGTSSPSEKLSVAGNISATGAISASNLAGTTYTPTGTAVSNVTSVTTYVTAYQRVGNTVTIGGRCQIQATASGLVRARLSVPVATNFANNYDAGGSGVSSVGPNCAIYADTANDDLLFEYTAAAGGFLIFYFNVTYRIL